MSSMDSQEVPLEEESQSKNTQELNSSSTTVKSPLLTLDQILTETDLLTYVSKIKKSTSLPYERQPQIIASKIILALQYYSKKKTTKQKKFDALCFYKTYLQKTIAMIQAERYYDQSKILNELEIQIYLHLTLISKTKRLSTSDWIKEVSNLLRWGEEKSLLSIDDYMKRKLIPYFNTKVPLIISELSDEVGYNGVNVFNNINNSSISSTTSSNNDDIDSESSSMTKTMTTKFRREISFLSTTSATQENTTSDSQLDSISRTSQSQHFSQRNLSTSSSYNYISKKQKVMVNLNNRTTKKQQPLTTTLLNRTVSFKLNQNETQSANDENKPTKKQVNWCHNTLVNTPKKKSRCSSTRFPKQQPLLTPTTQIDEDNETQTSTTKYVICETPSKDLDDKEVDSVSTTKTITPKRIQHLIKRLTSKTNLQNTSTGVTLNNDSQAVSFDSSQQQQRSSLTGGLSRVALHTTRCKYVLRRYVRETLSQQTDVLDKKVSTEQEISRCRLLIDSPSIMSISQSNKIPVIVQQTHAQSSPEKLRLVSKRLFQSPVRTSPLRRSCLKRNCSQTSLNEDSTTKLADKSTIVKRKRLFSPLKSPAH
ncbi:unnamed protein product [Didymodactylos carnosus]|nr:unnamed protein product [Didymodactylos carnosus]CAF3755102.1 unnamed protein product [Didymodactylos carnosus]